jgi:hypothetical protein
LISFLRLLARSKWGSAIAVASWSVHKNNQRRQRLFLKQDTTANPWQEQKGAIDE